MPFSHVAFRQPELAIEANLLIHILEFTGREVIVHCRRSKGAEGIFNGLLVPQSWALDVLSRAPLLPQKGFVLLDFIDTLYRTLERLRVHPSASRMSFCARGYMPNNANISCNLGLYGFNGPLSPLVRFILIARV